MEVAQLDSSALEVGPQAELGVEQGASEQEPKAVAQGAAYREFLMA